MKVIISDFVQGAKSAQGIAVIIDVFRAFSVACYCLDKQPKSYTAIGSVEQALLLKETTQQAVLIGEREGKKLAGFDHGNSPTELSVAEVMGKNIIHTTHAGTQGLVNAIQAEQILTGSFLNAQATVDYIRSQQPDTVTLVRMGWKAESNTDEDDLCAEYMRALLLDIPFDVNSIKPKLMASPCAERFFDPRQPWNPETDLELCLNINAFDFAVKANAINSGAVELQRL